MFRVQSLQARLNLPAPIATAAAELYERLKATAQDNLAEQRVELERDIAADRERLAQERRDFESDRAAFQQRVADINNDLDRLREQLKNTSGKLTSTEKELAAQPTRATTAEAQARAAESERERTAQKHVGDLARMREQAEGNERHLLGRLDEQKAQLQRVLHDRERETAAASKQAAKLERAARPHQATGGREGSRNLAGWSAPARRSTCSVPISAFAVIGCEECAR